MQKTRKLRSLKKYYGSCHISLVLGNYIYLNNKVKIIFREKEKKREKKSWERKESVRKLCRMSRFRESFHSL